MSLGHRSAGLGRGSGRRPVGLLVVTLLVALGGWLVTASPASAHNVLRSTTPQDGSTVARVPAEIVLTFDEPALAMGTAMVVTGPDGEVQDGPARLVDDTVQQPLRSGSPAGAYTVTWRVTSVDGHPVSGTFRFTASAASSPGPTSASGASSSSVPPTGDQPPAAGAPRVPAWVWPVIAAVLLLSALTSAAAARRRNRRSR